MQGPYQNMPSPNNMPSPGILPSSANMPPSGNMPTAGNYGPPPAAMTTGNKNYQIMYPPGNIIQQVFWIIFTFGIELVCDGYPHPYEYQPPGPPRCSGSCLDNC